MSTPTIAAPVRRLYNRQAESWVTAWPAYNEYAACPRCQSFEWLQLHWVEGEEDRSLFSCECGATWHDANWSTPASMRLVLAHCGQGTDREGVDPDLPAEVRALVEDRPRGRR
ncbi:hypothetical protein [Nocardiopsis halophila]|uniref:hypothetical protein n=1 Tax=Nocardiopsis halophila TaxID=141692 RepID=UPI00034C981D|nr:hypothetical protein [Nocardiopsis halophila]